MKPLPNQITKGQSSNLIPDRDRNLCRDLDTLTGEEVPGEVVAVHQLEQLPVDVDVDPHVEVPHRHELAAHHPAFATFTFDKPRSIQYYHLFVTFICFLTIMLKRNLMSSDNSALGHS